MAKKPSATLPTSTMTNKELDRVIVDREPVDDATLNAPWAWKQIRATVASSVRRILGWK
jgi:hypothetical protein